MTSNTTNQTCNTQELFFELIEPSYSLRVAFTLFMFTIFVVGVGGNLLTCIVIYFDRSMHTATNYYLFNLAVSDLVVAFGILLELNVFSDYPIKFDDYGDVVCQAHFCLVIGLWNNGILIMTALAIERYIAVWHPMLLKEKLNWRRVMRIMYVIWSLVILETVPEMWTVQFVKTRTSEVCMVVPSTFAKLLNAVLALVTFVIPLGIMTFAYAMVAFKVNATQKNNSIDKIFNHRNNSRRVNNLVIALTLSFLVCWLPFFSLRVLVVLEDWCQNSWSVKYWEILMMVAGCNSWFSIVLNPMLFSLMSTKFRKALKRLWDNKFRRHESVNHRTRSVIV